jgi:hypothetical protein
MSGRQEPQVTMLAFINLEARVAGDHPLPTIKKLADLALGQLSSLFDRMHAEIGRPFIPPERLFKASSRVLKKCCRRRLWGFDEQESAS